MKLQIKPATPSDCTYIENNRTCRERAVGELRAHGETWPLCTRHIAPAMHPTDLHGSLYRWAIVRGT